MKSESGFSFAIASQPFEITSEKWFPIPNLYMLGALTQLIFLSKRPKFKFDCFNFINFILNKVLTVHQSDSDSKFAIVSSGIWFQGRLCNSVIRSYNHNDLTNTGCLQKTVTSNISLTDLKITKNGVTQSFLESLYPTIYAFSTCLMFKWPKMAQSGPKWPKQPKWPKVAQSDPKYG